MILSLLGSALTILAPLLVALIKAFIRDKEKQEQFIKSYYSFLDKLDKSVQVKVANHIALKQARLKKQQELLDRKRKKILGETNEES